MLISCVWQSSYRLFTALLQRLVFFHCRERRKKEIIFVIVPSLILHFSRCLSGERIIFFFRSFNGSLLQNLYIYMYKGTINKVDKVILQKVTRANELNELDLASA